jgi:hypothetical protein
MNNKEILEYNKRCAEFLGYKVITERPYDGAITVQEGCNNPSFLHDRMPDESWYVYPKFDSDWNWIMEVVEAIEKLYEGNAYCVQIKQDNCHIFVNTQFSLAYNKFVNIFERDISKKEAVVKAINQFLIWYEKNKL